MHHPEAKNNAAAELGKIYYVGHGKFAQKHKPGTSEGSYQCLMLLNRKAILDSQTRE